MSISQIEKDALIEEIEQRMEQKYADSLARKETGSVLAAPREKWFRDEYNCGGNSLMTQTTGNSVWGKRWEPFTSQIYAIDNGKYKVDRPLYGNIFGEGIKSTQAYTDHVFSTKAECDEYISNYYFNGLCRGCEYNDEEHDDVGYICRKSHICVGIVYAMNHLCTMYLIKKKKC